ncbi:MAG: hypothetical protein ACI9OJ_002807, partial [Myxococcota bacterium]
MATLGCEKNAPKQAQETPGASRAGSQPAQYPVAVNQPTPTRKLTVAPTAAQPTGATTETAPPSVDGQVKPPLKTSKHQLESPALKAKLSAALEKRGASWIPRTKHKTPDGKPHFTNRLILEQSPYLLQHAHNPVNWFPWGDEAFALAKQLDRPVLMSVGYATCHWCHVMEEESFEDLEIAKYMSDNFICIKVDREERPDVDGIYMDAVNL